LDAAPRHARPLSRAGNLLAGAALVVGIGLAASAIAYAADQPAAAKVIGWTPRRAAASISVIVALVGAIIFGVAIFRAAEPIRRPNGRRGALTALTLAPVGIVGGAIVVATAKGGVGTGNGIAGGVVAVTVGLIGITLGWLALARSRQTS